MRSRIGTVVLLALLMGMLAKTDNLAACPGCKEAVAAQDIESDSDVYSPSQLARAYNYSIYFMLTMPALILTFFGAACYILTKRAAAARSHPASFAADASPTETLPRSGSCLACE